MELDAVQNPSIQGTQGQTLLAPTDAAFRALDGPVNLAFLRDSGNADRLTGILRYHIVGGVFTSPLLMDGSTLSTDSGDIGVSVDNQIIMFNQATATSESILANNGVLYVIDAVLTPPSLDRF
jgi:transforming growth factor-beta-induced protein